MDKATVPGNVVKLFEDYKTYLTAQGCKFNTLRNYVSAAGQFLRSIKYNYGHIGQESIDKFVSGFNSRVQTQNVKKIALKNFLGFIKERGINKQDYRIKTSRVARRPAEFFLPAEQLKYESLLRSSPAYFRDYVISLIMLYGGLRLNEVLNLRLSDAEIGPTGGRLRIRESKTGAGYVYIKERIRGPIERLILERKGSGARKDDYLFISRRNRGLNIRTFELLFQKYLRLAGISKDITPHGLRHTCAMRLREKGVPREVIQRILRHADASSTDIYAVPTYKEEVEAVERLMKVTKKLKDKSIKRK